MVGPVARDARAAAGPARPPLVVQRAYLGEYWDYAVRPGDSAVTLRVTARPQDVFEVDEAVWLALDPTQMAHIQ